MIKFLFIFDTYLKQTTLTKDLDKATKKSNENLKIEAILAALVESLSKIVSLDFLKHCTINQI